jgi:YD repeat-containing protein
MVTDEAGISRTNTVDGLGRLTQVAENGISATTNYVYDVLGNLTGVAHTGFATACYTPQGTAVNRSFKYDSLARLANACNPETSALTYYEYDGAFNLTARTDARGIRAALFYDGLNRLTDKEYSDYAAPQPTPWVHYIYQNTTSDFISSVGAGSLFYTYAG